MNARVDAKKLTRLHVALGSMIEWAHDALPKLRRAGVNYTEMPRVLREREVEFGPFWDLPEWAPQVIESAFAAVGVDDPDAEAVEVAALEFRIERYEAQVRALWERIDRVESERDELIRAARVSQVNEPTEEADA